MADAPLRIAPSAAAGFAIAMQRERGVAPGPAKPPAPLRAVPSLREDDVDLGQSETGGAIGISLGALIDGRLLIQGLSGAGKSWTLRRLIEQTHGRTQQIVIDPEGEFAPRPSSAPGFWMREATGVLRPAVEAYLTGGALSSEHVAALRAYIRQWIEHGAWAGPAVQQLRRDVDLLTSRPAISAWLDRALEKGIDPL